MTQPPFALVAGATGAVGSRLLDRLLARTDGTRVLAVARGPAPRAHPRLEWRRTELDALAPALAGVAADEAYCCLGTTMRAAGSRAAFRAVDLEGVASFAAAARTCGAGFLGLVSAAGADPTARNFYLRTKGEAEAGVAALGFDCLAIVQPGLLRGPREEFRLGERLGQLVAPLSDVLMRGPLSRYRSVGIDTVAAALEAARRLPPGLHRLDPAAIEALAHGR
ncbi:NAD(P)H-binding protein [Thioalkalivibrio sp. XN8]|uniref:NAD(P)H-binding protein n=1 Tax=Thioalkalivibrio sp. XN8 TaxID=2712863 RepID=UPI0013EE1D81|nr:NAD(P)H-binding protein [Thioalkalivibrio sp. XN8]NGP51928.1 NAD(P)H-binding protein [Thioalkalivibrio sp. XN8]